MQWNEINHRRIALYFILVWKNIGKKKTDAKQNNSEKEIVKAIT